MRSPKVFWVQGFDECQTSDSSENSVRRKGKLGQDRGHWLKRVVMGDAKDRKGKRQAFLSHCLPSIWVAEGKGDRIESWKEHLCSLL